MRQMAAARGWTSRAGGDGKHKALKLIAGEGRDIIKSAHINTCTQLEDTELHNILEGYSCTHEDSFSQLLHRVDANFMTGFQVCANAQLKNMFDPTCLSTRNN